MRPDEHKKKRSAQYQKKHGTVKEKSNPDGKQRSKLEKTPQSKAGAHVASIPHARKQEKNVAQDSSSSASEDDQASIGSSAAKSYRRRQIVSNWSKYELPPADSDSSLAKGEDFNNLLSLTRSAVAHFRFKEEQEWEEAVDDMDSPHFLALDCSQLASSLHCLPLYTQLGLDTNLFTHEQLTAIHQAASMQQESFVGSSSAMPSSSAQTDNNKPLQANYLPIHIPGLSADLTDLNKFTNLVKSDYSNTGGAKMASNLSVNPEFTKSKVTNTSNKPTNCLQDSNFKLMNSEVNKEENTSAVSDSLEDELDVLLTMNTSPSVSTSSHTKQTTGTDENLEDWLDSVLD